MIDHTRKQYRKLVGMLFLKKLTNYGLLALLTIEVFFLFSCMTQGVTFNGIVTLTKNPFYPETVNTAVVNGNFLDLFTTIVTIAFALVTCILLVRKQYKEFLNTTTLAVGVFLTIGSLLYFFVNEATGETAIKNILVWYLVPVLNCICISQITTVSIEKIKQKIIEQSDLFSLDGIALEYEGLCQEWNKYLFVQQITKTIDYEVLYPERVKEPYEKVKVLHIVSEVPRTVVTVRLKNTFFKLDLCSSPDLRFIDHVTMEAEEKV